MKKTLAFVCSLGLAGCSSSPPPSFAPLDYSYLRPINFKVSSLNIVNNYVPGADESALNANNPAPPAATLMTMLNNRLQPNGQPGTGTVTVQVASINEVNGSLAGQMTVDINLASPDGRTTGFAEASVSASQPAPDGDPDSDAMKLALYNMTKQLMTAINVQLPYQITHNISSWVAWTSSQVGASPGVGTAPGAIQATPLGAPGSSGSVSTGSVSTGNMSTGSVGSTPAAVSPAAPPLPVMAVPAVPNMVPPGFSSNPAPTALTPPQ
jgi:hypothetical protein